jgi:hypothetical protein
MKLMTYLLLLLLPLGVFAREIEWTDPDWTLEVSGAYYLPSSTKIRHLYSGGWVDYQVLTSKRMYDFVDVWGSVNWMGKQRTFRDEDYNDVKNRTKIYVLPLAVGCSWIYPILPCTEVYFGVGGCFSFLNINNHCTNYKRHGLSRSPFKHHIQRTDFGALIKCGVQYALSNDLFVDLFANYLSQRFHFGDHRKVTGKYRFKHHLNLSGFKFGLAIGVYF